MTGGTEHFTARIGIKRQPATGAHRPFQKSDFAPALGTKLARSGDRRTAGHAKRREQEIERTLPPRRRFAAKVSRFRPRIHAPRLTR
jgi:hypothetical protein